MKLTQLLEAATRVSGPEPRAAAVRSSEEDKLSGEPDAKVATGTPDGAEELLIFYVGPKRTLVVPSGEGENSDPWAYNGRYHPQDIKRWYREALKRSGLGDED